MVLGTGGGSPGSTASSRSISIREMMQKAVLAARATATLDVDEDAPIPTLHWPPDPTATTTATTSTTTTAGAATAATVSPGWKIFYRCLLLVSACLCICLSARLSVPPSKFYNQFSACF